MKSISFVEPGFIGWSLAVYVQQAQSGCGMPLAQMADLIRLAGFIDWRQSGSYTAL